jgi:hypothetical protein
MHAAASTPTAAAPTASAVVCARCRGDAGQSDEKGRTACQKDTLHCRFSMM